MVPEPLVYRQALRDSTRWNGFAFRPGDIVVTTPSKCGTTWLQLICAVLVLGSPELPAPLTRLSPWLDMLTRPLAEVLADLEAQQHRRFVKTHVPLDGLPWRDDVFYVCVGRDPRDVALSWDNHQANTDRAAMARARAHTLGLEATAGPPPEPPATLPERFWAWVDDPTPVTEAACNLALTVHHVDTVWRLRDRPNVVLLHYADLLADLDSQIRLLAARLGIEVPAAAWPDLVAAATLARMRQRADELAPNADQGIWLDNAQFFHRGTRGEWREFLDGDGRARYRTRIDALASPELAAWLHRDAWPG